MPANRSARACAGCGFPTLDSARRCPYCRATIARQRTHRRRWWHEPLLALATAWGAGMLVGIVVAWFALGPPFAVLLAVPALAPVVGAALLQRRWRIRIRSFSDSRRAPARGAEPTRSSRPSDSPSGPNDGYR